MASVLVVVLLAKLRIGTGQCVVELLQFVGFTVGYLAHRIPTPLCVVLRSSRGSLYSWPYLHTHAANAQSPSYSHSHRDFGSLLNRLYSAIAA
jgi:hypothetical protein